MRIQFRHRPGKNTVMPRRQDSGAVRPNQSRTYRIACIQKSLFQRLSFRSFFSETCRNHNDGPRSLFLRQDFHRFRRILGSHGNHSQIHLRQFMHVPVAWKALNHVFLRVHRVNGALELAIHNMFHYFSTRLGDIVGRTNNNNRFRFE